MKAETSSCRVGGVLLHPTSLPGPDGIGDLGDAVYYWLDWLHETGCMAWQVLPLGPTGYGDSPYQSFSAMAGNPMLVSLRKLISEGLLSSEDFYDQPDFADLHVDFGKVIQYKNWLLNLAWQRFRRGMAKNLREEFERFCHNQVDWLDDFALFMALKAHYGGNPWTAWDPELRQRHPDMLKKASDELKEFIEDHCFRQFLFFRQWNDVFLRAHELGIQIIGDVPIFLAQDSCDVWAHQELFFLDEGGLPTVVAGVPPDYFSVTGQLWGNPLYRWERLRADDYLWWKNRLEAIFNRVDVVRLDHFRGFEAYWEIPASAPTAETGRWVKGPGSNFFSSLKSYFNELPLIAEDLGVITPEVEELRDSFGFAGMKVLQFAFDEDPDNEFLPHNFSQNCVVYTGTHDNDTTRGWYEKAPAATQDFCRRYLARNGEHIAWEMIRAAWASVAETAIAPLQDFLELGSEARMNFPGREQGNWAWRVREDALSADLAERVRELNMIYGRMDREPAEREGDTLQ
jgi:4-alpha-glucanotransferase